MLPHPRRFAWDENKIMHEEENKSITDVASFSASSASTVTFAGEPRSTASSDRLPQSSEAAVEEHNVYNTSTHILNELQLLPEKFSPEHWASAERMGFPLSSNIEQREAELSAMPLVRAALQRCEKHWQTYSKGIPLLSSATRESMDSMRHTLCHYGAPSHIRGVIWLTLSGMAVRMEENVGFCRSLLRRHGYMRDEHGEAIEKDLYRTFPSHPYFSPGEIGTCKARNVLHALCWRNPLLNYCQSFNYLVAFLLLVLDDEESTFWLMCHLLENLLPNDLYSETLIGTKVDQYVLETLVQERLPQLARHFAKLRFEVGTLVSAWIMVLFVNVFPILTVIRVWDCLFAEHAHPAEHSCVPLAIILAVLKLHQSELLRCNDAGDVVLSLNHSAKRLFDAEKLVRTATEMRLVPTTVQRMRHRARPTVVEEHQKREQRRAALRNKSALLQEEETAAQPPITTPTAVDSSRRRMSTLPIEPHQGAYSDFFAGTGFAEKIAVNAWRRLVEANRLLEDAHGEKEQEYYVCNSTTDMGSPRWRKREESCGCEMEDLALGDTSETDEEIK
ncbi:Rab-GTPase-TBC domain [Trypanosoma melophagium]|uniref:Rab-GTPase-TBC domain n=1 Tax=Trypanosoma melophagium TaxID=715481 RepID=UPI003519E6B0|nr:Rab-GTPase-TBC domain [Trypanosoma melophagium]